MAVHPEIGQQGGQQYDVARAIRSFLRQMAEGGTRVAPAVIKELIQNADDAGAEYMSVVLDERPPRQDTPPEYYPLCGPSLVVTNSAPFRTANEVEEGEKDDFSAICDVAGGHKRAQATAAGRFGIGFNSVYFITDLPAIFSRREVHVFDLLHTLFANTNGWRFPLDEFPASACSSAGPLKNVLASIFPKSVLKSSRSFTDIANDPKADYAAATFRLPLRVSQEGTPSLYDDRFGDRATRLQLLYEVTEQAARSVLFLKNIREISVGVLSEKQVVEVGRVEISPATEEYRQFLADVAHNTRHFELGNRLECALPRTVGWRTTLSSDGTESDTQCYSWSFEVRHVAQFDDAVLLAMRERLHRNEERAVPWASMAIPLDLDSMRIDGGNTSAWRVFLPLDERGPCACPLSAALFVGPSRRNNEFRVDGSDEAKRKTEWNKALVERALVPLLRNATADLPELCSSLIANSPREYLSLFPVSSGRGGSAKCLSEHFQTCFSAEPWVLRVFDLWGKQIDLFVEADGEPTTLEMIPEWLAQYQDRFEPLSHAQRHFIPFALGDAIRERLSDATSITVERQPGTDVYRSVLAHTEPPNTGDLTKLLSRLCGAAAPSTASLDGLWCFQSVNDEAAVRYQEDGLYIYADSLPTAGIHRDLLSLKLAFLNTQWVASGVGLPSLSPEKRRELGNVIPGDDNAVFTLLARLEADCRHDSVDRSSQIEPIVEFLIKHGNERLPPDIPLGFLVRTAQNKMDRRCLGVIFLRPEKPSPDDSAMWDAVFRRIFAEVHPDFTSLLRRLLTALPKAERQLDEPECRLLVARHDVAFGVLHEARLRDPTIVQRIAEDFKSGLKRGGAQAVAIARAAALLMNYARRHWDEFSPIEQATILALPIHRKPDGALVSLATAAAVTPAIDQAYRLQSADDLRDAPIDLPEGELLQPSDPAIATFYRQQLGLEVHGRVAVLKDVLRQIGSPDTDNETLLEYLAKYFDDTLQQLLRSADGADRDDADELQRLIASARTVPCLDGDWRVADENCTDCSAAVRLLKGQGWKAAQLPDLLAALFHGQAVATADPKLQKLLRQLHDLPEWPAGQVYDLAISSESPDLSLETRCKLLVDNWRDSPPDVTRASVLGSEKLPTYGGTNELAACVCVVDPTLGAGVMSQAFPNSVHLQVFAKRYGVDTQVVRKLMQALSIPTVAPDEVQDRITEDFADVWARLDDTAKLDLINYVGARKLTEQLEVVAADLEVVRVDDPQVGWATPDTVLSPRWLALRPPGLPPKTLPKVDGLTPSGRAVWEQWCGIRQLDDVLRSVVDSADALAEKRKPNAATKINQWLDSLTKDKSIHESDLCAALQNNRWVFARRRSTNQFRCPSEVLVHEADNILGNEFWVPAIPLPSAATDRAPSIRLQDAPPADIASVTKIAICLEQARSAKRPEMISVYRMLRDLLGRDDSLARVWSEEAATRRVYRLYRTPDRSVSGRELFVGQADDSDFGELLFCLSSAKDASIQVITLYERLGVSDRPTAAHALFALQRMRGPISGQLRTYAQLVEILRNNTAERFSNDMLLQIKIPTCNGTFEPLAHCYWDEEWGVPGHVHANSASRLIDVARESTQRLVQFLDAQYPGLVVRLRHVAEVRGMPEIQPVETRATAAQVLGPWRDWFDDLRRSASTLRETVQRLNFQVPDEPIDITVAASLTRRYQLPDGSTISPSEDWLGPVVEHDGANTVYVAQEAAEKDYLADATALQNLDHLITARVAELLTANQAPAVSSVSALTEVVDETLERPSAVLARIRQVNESHFFHQYHDQAADPNFAPLFDKFRKTRASTADYEELKSRMWSILRDEFVKARRDQIRGHGYDELSVFAELVQNAEDSYVQRRTLGMDSIDDPDVTFTYFHSAERILVVEHRGRPFNYWRHGDLEDHNYSRDVEGVLRSAGSYKPLSRPATTVEPTVGRFGLGFKSVYLLTDAPIIHSGQWHFRIDAGCLPTAVPPPVDLNASDTRIVLPLRPDVREIEDPHGQRLVTLVPFLRCIKRLRLTAADAPGSPPPDSGTLVDVRVERTLISGQDGITVELNHVSGVTHVPGNAIRFLRFRHSDHAGQLGIYLGPDDSPAPWHDAFNSDMYAVLPLKSLLGTGVGVSHLLEVQSGRTHLVDPETNRRKFAEVAALLSCIPQVVAELAHPERMSEWLAAFWSLWVWDRGDGETADLRTELARSLAALAREHLVVPTLGSPRAQRISDRKLYYFSRIPDPIRDIILRHEIPLDGDGSSRLTRDVVVLEAFANAFRRICNVAGDHETDDFPVALTWPAIGDLLAASDALASTPELLSELVEQLPANHADNVLDWLRTCRVAAIDGELRTSFYEVGAVLSYEGDGLTHLPRRLLLLLDERYGAAAVELLKKAGLNRRLPAANIKMWLDESLLREEEAEGLLRFLFEDERYKDVEYRGLKYILRGPWYPDQERLLVLGEVVESGRLSGDFLEDPEFKAWLGLVEETQVEPPPPEPPLIDAASCLSRLHDWWQTHGANYIRQYEARTYPGGAPPELQSHFRDTTDERRRWLLLLLVGSLHSMGRAKPEQHRRFLELCDRRGWMNVFADANSSAQRWIDVLEQYLDEQTEELAYYQWMMHFIRIFQISRWLPVYVNQFLFINQRDCFGIDQILRPAADPHLTGSGETAPELRLGPGACFILRELIRLGLLDQQAAHPYCYVPVKRVRDTMARFGCPLDDNANPEQSIRIHRFLAEHLDHERALFGNSFDLPLQALSEDPDLQCHVFEDELPDDPQLEM